MKRYLFVGLLSLALMFAFVGTFAGTMVPGHSAAAWSELDGKVAMTYGAFVTAAVFVTIFLMLVYYVTMRLMAMTTRRDLTEEERRIMEKYK
jgi:large-conductance mechanosensitive channel